MKKILLLISVALLATNAKAQCTNKIQIESILVNACNNNGSVPEEYNEMVRFKNGSNPLNISNISVGGSSNASNPVSGKWPNTNQHWNGLTENATTSALTASLQATVISSCGKILEPPAGIIPANKEVIMITSQQMSPAYNSFANLTDTIYVVYQTTLTTTGGHFANHTSTGTRNFVLFDNGSGCSDTVHYDTQLLTTQPSTSNYDGGTVVYDNAGNATYTNIGCHAPFVPLSANAGTGGTICNNATFILNGSAAGPYLSFAWTGGAGTFSNASALTTTYTPSAGENGTVTFTLTVNGKCVGTSATSTVSIHINPAPSPTITSSNGASLCNGNSTILSASSTGTLTTTWSWNPGSATTSTLSVNPTTGTQVYTLTATNTCGSTNATYTVTTNPLPTITIVNDSVCNGGAGSLTASGADTYTWNTGTNGATISSSNITSNTNFTVTATNTLTTCQNTQVGHIIVRNPPSITTNSVAICQGVQTILTASGGASNSYTWSPGGPSGNDTYSVTPSNTNPIIVTGADVFGCINTNTVTVNAQPVFTINPGGICPGASTVLTPNPAVNTATTYSWVPLNLTTTNTAPSVTVQPSSTTHYTITSTNPSGCSYMQTDSVVVNNSITITPPTNTLICSGVTSTLSVSGASAYTWLASAGAVTPVTAGDFSSVLVNQTGSVTYTVSGSSGSCNNSTIFTVNVAPAFTIAATVSPSASVCPNSTVTLTGNPAATYTYTWSNGVTDGATFTPASTQTYTLTGIDANGCKSTINQNITVYSTSTISVTSPSICGLGSTATLTANGATTYTWSSTTSGGHTNTTTSIPTVNPQTYTVIGTDGNGCLSSVATSTVVINALPVISITSSPANATTCAGSTITLSGNGANTYAWTGGVIDGTAFTPAASPQIQTYTVTGTDLNGCKGTKTQTITINALPTVTVTSANICLGFSTSLNAGGALTYTWSTLATGATINVSPTTNQSYTVAGTDANGCINAAVSTVTVNPLPVITIASNPNGAAICSGASATLTASSTSTLSVTFDWNNTGTNTNPIVVNPNVQTAYTVVGTDINGCESATKTITININQAPTSQTITGNTFVCVGALGGVTVLSAPNNGYWTGPAPSTATVSANSTTANITHGGIYTLNTINNCGNAQTTYTVTADSVKASFTASPVTGQTPLSVTFTNTSVGNSLTYGWSFGDVSSSTNPNPTHIYTGAGIYQAVLLAIDNLGCKGLDSLTITVNDVPSIIVIPNIFSPNGDNINDVFVVNATGISNFDCKVYDRWGLLLHEWDGIDGGWDGKAKNGVNCTDGTYFYLITYLDSQNKSYIKNGFFQLIR
jgi:gliding motility-associated-like protein